MKKFLKYIFGGILFLLGFGCDKEGFGIGGGYCMYGQPHADYKLIGDVKGQDGKPIQGIRVVFTPDPASHPYNNDTLYTDAKGHFQSDRLKYDFPNVQKANVIFEDVDGADNGSFKTKTLQVSDLKVSQTAKGSGSWDEGKYTIQADAKLEKED